MTHLRSVQDVTAWIGRALFLGGIFLMVTGDWPRSTLLPARWVMPLHFLAWPWLYPTMLAASFVLLVSSRTLRPERSTSAAFLHPPLALLAATFFLSVACSQVPSLSEWAFGCFLAILGFTLAVAGVVEDETCMTWLPIVLAAAALFLAVRVILWRYDEGLAFSHSHIRNNAWLGKIQIAWVLNLIAPFLLARALGEKTRVAALSYGAAWLLSGAAIYLLFAKTGSLTFALTTLSLCVLNARSWRWLLPFVGVIGLVVTVIVVSPTASTSLVTSLLHPEGDRGIVLRQNVWRQTVQMIVDHPVVGIGLGTYDDVAHTRYGPPANPHFFRNGWHAHNMFLHVFAETGLVGFGAWCLLGLVLVRFLLRQWRDGEALGRLNSAAGLCVLVAFALQSMTEAMIAARVHASLRMNLTLALLVVYGIRLASGTHASRDTDTPAEISASYSPRSNAR